MDFAKPGLRGKNWYTYDLTKRQNIINAGGRSPYPLAGINELGKSVPQPIRIRPITDYL